MKLGEAMNVSSSEAVSAPNLNPDEIRFFRQVAGQLADAAEKSPMLKEAGVFAGLSAMAGRGSEASTAGAGGALPIVAQAATVSAGKGA